MFKVVYFIYNLSEKNAVFVIGRENFVVFFYELKKKWEFETKKGKEKMWLDQDVVNP